MRFPANCLVVALAMTLAGATPRVMQNRVGRPHFYWVSRSGEASEFYAPGRAGRGWVANALYVGCVRRCPSKDEHAEYGGLPQALARLLVLVILAGAPEARPLFPFADEIHVRA